MAAKSITLTAPERLLRKCLLDCRDGMRGSPGMADLELRFTGGWVRDKLLGIASHDVDVALSTMTGEQFGLALQSFMQERGKQYEAEAEKQGIKAGIKNIHKIAANPEKSKHLETVTTKLFGIDLDFVNLRKEVYSEDSRNPHMQFGTPEEDAFRRDATVNALFYNVDTQQVEDYTGRGLADMKSGIIKTPLEPYKTFKDDPLRVLRLIRFASRLHYHIGEEELLSMKDKTIHEALRAKISRERVGVEIGKIVAGPDPLRGLMLVHDLGLYSTVFANPDRPEKCPDATTIPTIYAGLQKLIDERPAVSQWLHIGDDPSLAWTLAAYVPWKADETQAVSAAKEGIKASNVISKTLGDSVKNHAKISAIAKTFPGSPPTRVEAGKVLRQAGSSWRLLLLYSLMCDIAEEGYAQVMGRYQAFLSFIQDQNLQDAATLKPIVNGNEIKAALGVQKAGSWLKSALDMVVEWQFANPNGTADEAKAMVKQNKRKIIPD